MIGIAHRDAGLHFVGAHDVGHALGGLRGVGTLRFRNQILFGNAAADKVIAPHAAFAEIGVLADPPVVMTTGAIPC